MLAEKFIDPNRTSNSPFEYYFPEVRRSYTEWRDLCHCVGRSLCYSLSTTFKLLWLCVYFLSMNVVKTNQFKSQLSVVVIKLFRWYVSFTVFSPLFIFSPEHYLWSHRRRKNVYCDTRNFLQTIEPFHRKINKPTLCVFTLFTFLPSCSGSASTSVDIWNKNEARKTHEITETKCEKKCWRKRKLFGVCQ